MGAVYEARQDPLDRRVALKTLHPEYAGNKEAVARFFNEARALSRLEHPSIVQVSDFGNAEDGTAYLVMEYLRGQSLGRRLRDLKAKDERLPIVSALQFGFQIADVLAIAHAQGIVHRDIKPDNLMLIADAVASGGERVKLLDFGIAKLTNESDKGGVKTATQTVMGTPSYMSPEQCAGAGGVDAKTDVYALGCVLYEVFAGRPPFVAEGSGQIMGMHLFQSPPSLSSLAPKTPASIVDLVHRLLTKDKAKRPSMSEAADDIRKLLSKQPGGGSVERSRHPGGTDPNAAQTTVLPQQGTTLGRSIGQQVPGSARRSMLFGVSAVCLLGIGMLVVSRWNIRQPARPIPASPIPVSLPPTTPAPVASPKPVMSVVQPAQPPVTVPAASPPSPQVAASPSLEKANPGSPRTPIPTSGPRPPNRVTGPRSSGTSTPSTTKPAPPKPIGYVPL